MAGIVLSPTERMLSLDRRVRATALAAQRRELSSALAAGIQRVVAQSFEHDGSRETGAERARRFDMCAKLYVRLAIETGWSNQRVIDHLPYYLRCELDGKRWRPPRIGIWCPESLSRNQLER